MTSCTLDALLLLGKIAEKNLSELPHGLDTPMHYTRGPSTRIIGSGFLNAILGYKGR
jgi:hypothetical protein